jgi:hypothetical protein
MLIVVVQYDGSQRTRMMLIVMSDEVVVLRESETEVIADRIAPSTRADNCCKQVRAVDFLRSSHAQLERTTLMSTVVDNVGSNISQTRTAGSLNSRFRWFLCVI